MVLLTSSAVSVVISSGVVCTFTFLLFLSGYVLQQQTVRSLQEAIRRPPEWKPVPTLPPQFRDPDNETASVSLEQPSDGSEGVIVGDRGAGNEGPFLESIQVPVVVQDQDSAHLKDSSKQTEAGNQDSNRELPMQRLAYMFALLEPSYLCSALLFAKEQRSSSRLAVEPSIVLLYPSTWESDSSPLYASVLSFMREVQDLYDLIYHPVQINSAWNVRSQLLGAIQWKRWEYDQALYLRSPGLMLDSQALDAALGSPNPRKSWAPLSPSSGDNPDVMLVTDRGLQSPRKEMRSLVESSVSRFSEAQEGELDTVNLTKNPAYVLFDEDPAVENDGAWYGDLRRKFEGGRKTVCAGSGLLETSL